MFKHFHKRNSTSKKLHLPANLNDLPKFADDKKKEVTVCASHTKRSHLNSATWIKENLIFKHCAKVTFGSIWRKEALATMSTKVWWIGILNLDGRSNQLNFNFGLWGKTNFVCWEIRNIGALRVETSSRMWFVCYWSSGGLPCQESCDGWVLLWVVNPAAGNISLSRVFFASENIWTCETWGQAVTYLQGDQTSFAYLDIFQKAFTKTKS